MVLLGLSRGNVDRLLAGDPVLFDGSDIGLPGIKISIIFGETERAIVDVLDQAGVLPPGIRERLYAEAGKVGL